MPKPYRIGVDIEEMALGAVIRRLNAMPGVVAIHLNLDADKRATKPNGDDTPARRKTKERSLNRRTILQVLAAHDKPMGTTALYEALNGQGINTKTVYNLIYNSVKGGYIRRPGKKSVAITAKGQALLAEKPD